MPLLQNQFKFFSVLKCLLNLFKFQYTATNKNKSVSCFGMNIKKLPADFTIINPRDKGIFVPVNFSGYEEGRCERGNLKNEIIH